MIGSVAWIEARMFFAAALAVTTAFVFLLTLIYLASEVRRDPHRWHHRLGNRAAVTICGFMAGEALSRAWGATLIIAYAQGADIGQIESAYPVALIGSIGMLAATLFMVRMFSPDRTADWIWITVALFAAGVGGAFVII